MTEKYQGQQQTELPDLPHVEVFFLDIPHTIGFKLFDSSQELENILLCHDIYPKTNPYSPRRKHTDIATAHFDSKLFIKFLGTLIEMINETKARDVQIKLSSDDYIEVTLGNREDRIGGLCDRFRSLGITGYLAARNELGD